MNLKSSSNPAAEEDNPAVRFPPGRRAAEVLACTADSHPHRKRKKAR